MRLSKIAYGTLVFLAMGISIFSLHYFITGSKFAPGQLGPLFDAHPMLFLLHVGGGFVALTMGVLQFMPRTRRSSWHRRAGKAYVMACLLGGIGGIGIAAFSKSGLVAQTGFLTLAVLWILATLKGYAAIQKRDIARHRIWMWRSYGMTSGAITLRLILPIGSILGVDFAILYPFTAWASWISSLMIAELLRRWLDRAPTTPREVSA